MDDYASDPITISGEKTWKDYDPDSQQEGKHPDSITINLMKKGSDTPVDTRTVNAACDWAWSFDNLAPYTGNEKNEYYITEVSVADYETHYEDNGNVTNIYSPDKTYYRVIKDWVDSNDQDGKRPDSVTVQLCKTVVNDDQTTTDVPIDGKTLTLNESNGWKGMFGGLDIYENDKPIVYTVKEAADLDGYESTVSLNPETHTFTVTNTHTPETVDISGSKTWNDGDNQDGIRPDSITIHLLADGKQVAVQNVTEKEQWSWNFGSLPKYRDGGVEIKYTIAEDAVEGYTATVNGYDVTNTHTVKPTATPAPTAAPTARPDDPAPTATPTPAPAVAQTSDNSHPMLWVALLVVAAIGMTGVVVLKKRQRNK